LFSPKSRKKILVPNDSGSSYFEPFRFLGLGYTSDVTSIERYPDDIAMVVFTGGEDVSPSIYGRQQHPRTYASMNRDIVEMAVFHKALDLGLPMAGIYRGAQFLCVMAGGKLVQDISGHGQNHSLTALNPGGNAEVVGVTSTHHQMQYPFDLVPGSQYEVLAWAQTPLSTHYAFDDSTIILAADATPELRLEPDVVWYPEIKALGAQFHPEWMADTSPGLQYYRRLVSHYLVPIMEANEPRTAKSTNKTVKTAG